MTILPVCIQNEQYSLVMAIRTLQGFIEVGQIAIENLIIFAQK